MLRFAPRDPALIAQFVRTSVIQPESHIWLARLNALRTWHHQHQDQDQDQERGSVSGSQGREHGNGSQAEESDAARRPVAVPLDARVGTFPLGQWVSEQRRAYRAGTLAT